MQAVVHIGDNSAGSVESRPRFGRLFEKYWDDVQHLNNFSPDAARALLRLEGNVRVLHVTETADGVPMFDDVANDPWLAVRIGLQERAAGRVISRNA